jgi:excisionase family DNA binding protein
MAPAGASESFLNDKNTYIKMLQLNAISTREAASVLGISIPYLHDLIRFGELKTIGTFGRSLVLDRHQVEALKIRRAEERRRRPHDGRLK